MATCPAAMNPHIMLRGATKAPCRGSNIPPVSHSTSSKGTLVHSSLGTGRSWVSRAPKDPTLLGGSREVPSSTCVAKTGVPLPRGASGLDAYHSSSGTGRCRSAYHTGLATPSRCSPGTAVSSSLVSDGSPIALQDMPRPSTKSLSAYQAIFSSRVATLRTWYTSRLMVPVRSDWIVQDAGQELRKNTYPGVRRKRSKEEGGRALYSAPLPASFLWRSRGAADGG